LFQPGGARLLHLSGITPALSASAAATCASALQRAREAGWLVSFDLNYRARLWSPEEARAGCEPFALAADILIMPERDARLIYGIASAAPAEVTLRRLAARFPQATLVLTQGADGALAAHPGGQPLHQPAFPAGDVGRIGGGDAFTAGLIYGRLTAPEGADWLGLGLQWGTAAAALKYTIPGDLPLIERAEVERLMASAGQGPALHR